MLASAMLFELRGKGRDLGEYNDTKQKQNEGASPDKFALPCHYLTYHTPGLTSV